MRACGRARGLALPVAAAAAAAMAVDLGHGQSIVTTAALPTQSQSMTEASAVCSAEAAA